MKKLKERKAFTIVELVIVIAVIAILATVLVPTFGNVIESAKDSAAKQEAKNAYTQYMVEHAAEGKAFEYMIYASDGRFVALHNGAAVGVCGTQEEALKAMVPEADLSILTAIDGGKLFAYGGENIKESLAGKKISILGDSISTYTGVSDNPSYNPTLKGGAIYYTEGKHGVYQADTWWQQVIDALGMELSVNNSWSGSCVKNERKGTDGAYINRCVQLHNTEGEEPDIIAIYLGTNDFGVSPGELGTASSIDYGALIAYGAGGYTYANPETVCEAYAIMLHKASVRYPDAEIYCLTPLPRINQDAAKIQLAQQFNEDIQTISAHFGAYAVDLYNDSGIQANQFFARYIGDTEDGGTPLHPGPLGMDAITGCFISALLQNSRYVTEEIYDVTYDLTDVMVDQGTVYAVQGRESFVCSFTAPATCELSVSVTMGGKDITDSCYDNGTVTIASVTGDISITAAAALPIKDAKNYRWEFNGTELVSVGTDGNTLNNLQRLAGSISDGVHKNSRYALTESIVLYHDRPWVIEWMSEGTWTDTTNTTNGALLFAGAQASATSQAPYFYRRHKADFFAIGIYTGGQYRNYGVSLENRGIDATAEHTWRLENRIHEDGSNMVYLYMDGNEIGAMNHYWIEGTDQNKEDNWVDGQDFVFSYMGTTPHTIGGCSIDYIQVWEGGA